MIVFVINQYFVFSAVDRSEIG